MYLPEYSAENSTTNQIPQKSLQQKSNLKTTGGYKGPFDLDDTFKRDDGLDDQSGLNDHEDSSINDRTERQESLEDFDF